jgi:hypothetical protein
MKRFISVLAVALGVVGFSANAYSQTRTSQLVITNSTGTTKFSQTGDGLVIDNTVVLQRPGNTGSTITLTVPATAGNRNFSFPESGGTLLTSATNTFTGVQTFVVDEAQGNSIIAAINAGNTTIDAARLDLTGVSGGSSYTPGAITHAQLTNSSTVLNSNIIGNALVQISSDLNTAASGRQFTLPNGTTPGATMVLYNTAGVCELKSSSNVYLKFNMDFTTNSSLTLIWNGSKWLEIGRSE